MSARSDLSPEAFGVLRALTRLGKIRHFDAVANELEVTGLATVTGSRLAITRKGRLFARLAERRRAERRLKKPEAARQRV